MSEYDINCEKCGKVYDAGPNGAPHIVHTERTWLGDRFRTYYWACDMELTHADTFTF